MSEKCHENETLMKNKKKKKNVDVVVAKSNTKSSSSNKSGSNKTTASPAAATTATATTGGGLSRINSETKSDDDSYENEITFFKLFRFADKIDKLLLLVGTLASLFGGLVYPFMFFMYGDLAGTFVDFDKSIKLSSAAANYSSSTSTSSVIDYANFLTRLNFLNNVNYTNKCTKTTKIDSDFDSRVYKSIKFYLTIGFVSLFVNYLANVCWNTACERQIKKMRNKLYERIIHHEIEFFDKHAPGELTSLISNNIDAIKMGIGFKLSDFLNMLCRSVACLFVALFSAWKFTLAFLALTPFIVASIVLMVIKMKQYSVAELRAYEGAGKIAYEMLSSIRVVLAYSLERKAISKYAANLSAAEEVAKKKGLLTGIFMSITTVLFNLFFAISLVYGTFLVQFDCLTYNVSKIIRALFCMVSCCFSTSQALPYFRDLAEAKVSAGKIFSILESSKSTEERRNGGGAGKRLEELNGEICFDNVYFSYPQRKEHSVLKGLNLTIRAGKTTAIVGHSGSGKSTILSLIQRFYTPNSGQITIDGHPIDELDIDWLRSQMAFVSQEPILFSNTISENIRLGRLEASDNEIIEAAVKAHAHQFISMTSEKYATQVGERGAHLSGGQKQRIAIARALIREPKIILLDEATSALDFESERVVQTALLRANSNGGGGGGNEHQNGGRETKKKMSAANRGGPTTTIIVAHRLSTIRQADTIVFLDECGRVRETGTHEELMERRGLYYEMVQAQTKCKRERTIESANFVGDDDEEENDEDDDDEAASCEEEINVAMKLMYRASSRKSTIRRGKRSRGSLAQRQHQRRQKIPFKYERKLFAMQKNDLGWMLLGCLSEMLHGLVFPCVALVFSEIFNIFALADARAQLSLAITYMYAIMAIAAVDFLATLSYSYSFALCGARLTRRVRLSMFSSMLRQEVAYHDIGCNKSSLLAASLSTMAPLCKGLTSDKIGLLSQALTSVGFAITIAFALNWKLALAVTAFVPISFYTGVFVGRSNSNTHLKAKFSNDAGGDDDAESGYSMAIESFENIRTIVSLGRERHFADSFRRIYEAKFKRTLALLHLHALFYSISSCLLFFIQACTFTLGYYLIKHDSLNVADLFRIYTTVTFSSMILGRVYAQLPDQRKSLEAAKWAFKIIERRSKIDSMSESGLRPCNEYLAHSLANNNRQSSAMLTALNTSFGSIQFENVTFSYPNRSSVKVLRGLNLTIKPGLVNAIVGVSGCGKSTILSLLLRFYDVDSGAIYLDNIDIRKLNIRWLRSRMGLVLQEPTLFNMSIFENISYGDVEREDIDLNKVIDVAIKSNIHYKIDSLPEKYDTIVGNKGSLLSGGEKQRIAIARALIRQPSVLLLDEATSALDNASEQVVQDALEKAQYGRTSIVIAHRLSTIQNANKISVIKDGALVEEGTHDELMQNEGSFYFNLYSHSI